MGGHRSSEEGLESAILCGLCGGRLASPLSSLGESPVHCTSIEERKHPACTNHLTTCGFQFCFFQIFPDPEISTRPRSPATYLPCSG